MKETLLIIDGSSLLYRAFYAIPSLTDSQGRPTNAVYGFLNMLLKLYEQLEPHYVAVAFDKDKHTFRNDLYDGYKATRKPAPDDLRPQFPLIREVLECLGIHVLELEGYEGDDIIGTVARQMEAKDFHIDIVTGDRDALQLVDENVTVHLTKKGITNMLAVTPDVMAAEYGYAPSQVVDMKALMGDTADNIPGVPGVGEKTAAKLIAQFQHVETLYDRIGEVKGKKLQEKLADNKDKAFLSKELATICCSVPVEYSLDMFLPQPRKEDVSALFRSLGFKNMLSRFAAFDRFASLADEEPAQDVSLQLLDDLQPQDLAGQVVAVEGVYEPAAPLPVLKALAIAGNQGVFIVPAGREGEYLCALADAALVVTSQGKQLVKAASPYTDKRLPLADIILAAYLLDPTRTAYGLAYLSEKFAVPLQEGGDEALRLAGDAQFSFDVWPKAAEALELAGLTTLYDTIEIPLIHTLAVMEMNGFTVDTERLMDMERELSLEADKLEEEIYDDAGETFNINSTKQLGVILFEKLGLPVIKKTKTGYSTDSAVLEALMDQHPMIPKILQFRALKKLISTYLDGLEPLISRETGRIYTSFNQMVTATGRLSSSDPNLQNIPIRTEQGRKIRSLFVPGEGYDYIVSGDYSQIELRLLAHLSQDPTMIDGFKKNQDIHRRTASEVFGIPWDEVTPEQRSHAKAVNFGIIYGISDFGLARNISISRQQAKEYIDSYFARYSTIHAYMDKLVAEARETGMAKTMFGRIRTLTDINSKNFTRRSFAERTAMNTPIQGSAADIIKLAMNAVQDELERRSLRSRLLVQVHDELVLEVPADEREEVETLLKDTMEHIVTLSVPLVVDIHCGRNWEEAK
ncbi:DNA polymerase I [Megasphaera butyrica]|mgnify:FL=1|uniref:DNA polymerase I n=1 Tax=Megasphaera butyrica TaxID=2981791 RepID=UPI000821A3C6|nr:DNA polymerase I [Megasphaera butyrica]MCU6714578.1 DNA polymerase I [Megasphaera butyrica]SCH63976.1 DNA polymerase I [uncultured Megasphaera sp.]SCJ10920.1 DNA polymerase I [uncultured Ruminococcus sp.]